jgi:hypothetical protein
MAKTPKGIEATKNLMAALVRMPPKPHEEMKVKDKKPRAQKKTPPKRG